MTASQKGTACMDTVAWKIFEDYGLKDKKKLSFDDFFALITDQTQDLSKVGCKELFTLLVSQDCLKFVRLTKHWTRSELKVA